MRDVTGFDWRSNKSPEDVAEIEARRVASMGRYHRSLSEEQKLERLNKSFHSPEAKARKVEVQSSHSLEELAIINERKSSSAKRRWESTSVEDDLDRRGKISRAHLARWEAMTEEERREWFLRYLSSNMSKASEAIVVILSDPVRREKWLRSSLWSQEALARKAHTKTLPEIVVGIYLERRYPGEWKFNGVSRDVVISGRAPDFVNTNGKKEVVEVFGRAYHPDEDEAQRKEQYSRFGYGCTVVWEEDACFVEDLDRLFKALG